MADKKKQKGTGDIDVKMWDPEAIDPLTKERGRCLEKDCSTRVLFLALRECAKRVSARVHFTRENCHPETIDLIEAIDKCVADKAFVQFS